MKDKKKRQSLFRIMPSYELLQICELPKELVLKSPRLWEDTYEGFFYKTLLTADGVNEAYKFLYEKLNSNSPDLLAKGKNVEFSLCVFSKEEKTLLAILKCIIQYYLIFCNCFSKDENESDAMWRIYSYDKTSIRVEFDFELLNNLEYIFFFEADYNDNFNFEEVLKKTFKIEKQNLILNTFVPFKQKRTAFKHEEEIRMLYKHNLHKIPFLNIERHPNQDPDQIDKLKNDFKLCFDSEKNFLPDQFITSIQSYLKEFKKEKTVVIDLDKESLKVNELIKSVMVNPQASDYYVSIIEKYCKHHNINFVGKSKLYGFSENLV